MQIGSTFLALLGIAHAQAPSKLAARAIGPYRIRSLGTYNTDPVFSGRIHMDLYVSDSNPADDIERHCRSEGSPTELETGFIPCYLNDGTLDSSFAWTLEEYSTLSDFTFQFSHSYMDTSLGPCSRNPDGTPVFCGTKTWARANITSHDVNCGKTRPIRDGFVQTQCYLSHRYLDAPVFRAIA